MIGEFFFEDTTRPLALVFFMSGLGFIGYYYVLRIRKDAH
jgi:hypothetical protein